MSKIDWNAPLESAEGKPSRLLERERWQDQVGDDRRRVQTSKYEVITDEKDWDGATTWLCDESGRTIRGGAPSRHDIRNVAA